VSAAPALAPPRTDPAATLTVQRGETATAIARRFKSADVTDAQAVMALYELNPQGFDGSVHRLREGAVLQVPDAARIRAVSDAGARAALRTHALPVQAIAQGAGTTPGGGDRLTLAGGGTGKAAGRGSAGNGADELARRTAMAEAESRIRELESILDRLRRLIELRETEMAAMRAEIAGLQAPAGAPSRVSDTDGAAPGGAAVASLRVAGPVPAPLAPVPAEPVEPGFDPLQIAAAALLTVLLAAGAWLLRRRARQTSRRRVRDPRRDPAMHD
jgi:pilus assembly protein FimV